MPIQISQSIGRYHILEQLGEGGMATVYKAYDTRLERDVAVKVIRVNQFAPSMLDQVLKRFEREAKALARLTHPNIVHVNDYGEHEGIPYLVMDYLSGGTLKQSLGMPMPWQRAVHLLLPIAEALAYAHEHNIIHRDIKPSNILLTEKGQPMLSDFGIAKILENEETAGLTSTGMGLGTPEYMAPEQWTGQAGPLADLYSLGVVLYELVTGRKPYTADTPAAIMLKQVNDPLPRPRQFVPKLPEEVEKVLFKALAKKPEDRYQSMNDFTVALEQLTKGQTIEVGVKQEEIRKQEEQKTLLASETGKKEDEETQEVPLPITEHHKLPTTRQYWVIGLVVLGIALFGILGGLISGKPAALLPTRTPAYTLASNDIKTPISTIRPKPTEISFPLPTQTTNNRSPLDGMLLLDIPAGEFLMGVTQQDQDYLYAACPACDRTSFHDATQQSIYLDEYWMDQTEVTTAQFATFINATGYRTTSEKQGWSWAFNTSTNDFEKTFGLDWLHPQGSLITVAEYGQYPAVQVSWNDASAYCTWAGRHLPTEAQWEKAARGTDGRLFPWGNNIPTSHLSNFMHVNGGSKPVGSYHAGASPYGVLDMAGNVWEWTGSFYLDNYYSSMALKNPPGPSSGTYRIARGGSWGAFMDRELVLLSSAFRYSYQPEFSSDLLGFRCAQDFNP